MWMYFLLEECLIEHVCGRLLRNLSMKLVDKVLVNHFWYFISFQNFVPCIPVFVYIESCIHCISFVSE